MYIPLTENELSNIKQALTTRNWRSLKTNKERFAYQQCCGNQDEIIAIGKEAAQKKYKLKRFDKRDPFIEEKRKQVNH